MHDSIHDISYLMSKLMTVPHREVRGSHIWICTLAYNYETFDARRWSDSCTVCFIGVIDLWRWNCVTTAISVICLVHFWVRSHHTHCGSRCIHAAFRRVCMLQPFVRKTLSLIADSVAWSRDAAGEQSDPRVCPNGINVTKKVVPQWSYNKFWFACLS